MIRAVGCLGQINKKGEHNKWFPVQYFLNDMANLYEIVIYVGMVWVAYGQKKKSWPPCTPGNTTGGFFFVLLFFFIIVESSKFNWKQHLSTCTELPSTLTRQNGLTPECFILHNDQRQRCLPKSTLHCEAMQCSVQGRSPTYRYSQKKT